MSTTRLASFFLTFAILFLGRPAIGLEISFVNASPTVYAEPHDIVLSPVGQLLYVADNGNDRIAVLDPFTLALKTSFGSGELGAPHDVAFDAAGRLLVADTDNSRIAIYAVDGATATLVGELKGRIRRPEGVTAHPNGRVYATGSSSGNIEGFLNGNSVVSAGGLSAPHDVMVADDGTLWVADAGNDRIVNFTEDLAIIRIIGGPEHGFDGPRYLDKDTAGRLYVADKYNHRVQVLSPDGGLLMSVGTGQAGQGAGLFDRPEGIAIRGCDVWFSDTYNDRIVRYRLDSDCK
ncbi:MAG: NHL repeat-containing protein [Pseudomonadota bacterium]